MKNVNVRAIQKITLISDDIFEPTAGDPKHYAVKTLVRPIPPVLYGAKVSLGLIVKV